MQDIDILVGGHQGGEHRRGGGEEAAAHPDDGEAEDDGGAASLGSQRPDDRLLRGMMFSVGEGVTFYVSISRCF